MLEYPKLHLPVDSNSKINICFPPHSLPIVLPILSCTLFWHSSLPIFNSSYALWWEVAGAIFYMLNPLLEFGTGSLK